MDEMLCCNNAFVASKDKKGLWIYKANLEPFFKKGTKILTKKLHDKPRYPIVLEIEKEFKDNTEKYLENLTIRLVKKLKQLSDK